MRKLSFMLMDVAVLVAWFYGDGDGMQLAIPVGAILQYAPAAIGLAQKLFGKKSPEQKAREESIKRLRRIAEQGLDPTVLNRAFQTINARGQNEETGVLSRLSAGGIDSSSGLAQEAAGAVRRSLGSRRGEARAAFDERSEAAKLAATNLLAGLPAEEDDTTGEALGSIFANIAARTSGSSRGAAPAKPQIPLFQEPDVFPEDVPVDLQYDKVMQRMRQGPIDIRSGYQIPRSRLSPLSPNYYGY